jgi:hypothetical protein
MSWQAYLFFVLWVFITFGAYYLNLRKEDHED